MLGLVEVQRILLQASIMANICQDRLDSHIHLGSGIYRHPTAAITVAATCATARCLDECSSVAEFSCLVYSGVRGNSSSVSA